MASFSSCSNDDDSAPTSAELLSNKWYLVQQEDTSTTPPTITVADACQQNTYFNFLDSGDLIAETFSLDMDDNCVSGGAIAASYDLSDDGEQIYLTSGTPPETQVVTVESLTSSELIISISTQRIVFER